MLKITRTHFHLSLPFLAFLFFGLVTVKDYGITWDAPENYYNGRITLNALVYPDRDIYGAPESLPIPQVLPFRVDHHFERYPPFPSVVGSVFSLISAETLGLMHPVEAHHAGLVAISSVGVLSVTLFAWIVMRSLSVSVVTGLMLGFSPQFFAHSHNNPKDAPTAALYITACLLFVLFTLRGQRLYLIMTGIVTGLTLASKFNGMFLLPLFVIYDIISNWKRLLRVRGLLSFVATHGIIASTSVLTSLFVWPWLRTDFWYNLQLIWIYINEVGKGLSVNYFSSILKAGIDVPWHYAPVMTLYALPLSTIAFAAIGIVTTLISMRSHTYRPALLLIFILMLTYGRYVSPTITVYNGIRHFFEVVPAISLLAGFGLWQLVRLATQKLPLRLGRLVASMLLVVAVAEPMTALARLYPYGQLYYNAGAGSPSVVRDRFDYDYWGFSVKELVDAANRLYPTGTRLNVHWMDFQGSYFPKNKLTLVPSGTPTDLVVLPHDNGFFGGARAYWLSLSKPVATVERNGVAIGYLFDIRR